MTATAVGAFRCGWLCFDYDPEGLMMIRVMVLSALFVTPCFAVWGQLPQMPDCLPAAQYEPALVANPGMRVTFRCGNATPLDLIRAIGRQTRLPIGVVPGTHPRALSDVQHSYNLQNVDATQALRKAIDGTGYSLKKEGAVTILLAADLAPRQKKALKYRFSNFPSGTQTMAVFALTLTTWIVAAMDNMGTGASIFGSTNDEQISIPHMQSATTEEIANRVVSQGSRGLWILTIDASACRKPRFHGLSVDEGERQLKYDGTCQYG